MNPTKPALNNAFLVCLILCNAASAAGRAELFVDEHLIERKEKVELRLNPPIKREVVFSLDKPWEGPTSAYFTVFNDEGKIRLYYRGSSGNSDDDAVTCYAESADGIHFTRPNLGLVEFNGSKENNIIFKGAHSASFAPFKDANPAAKPDELYKALCYEVVERKGTMTALASADGIRWRKMQERSVVPKGSYDSLNTVSWDPSEKKYRCFNRYWDAGDFKGVRAIQSRTSDDFVTWSEPANNRYADGVPREHFYTSSTTRCPGAEHIWLAFPMRFVPEPKRVAAHSQPGISDAVFMSSRDGVEWHRPFLEPWVPPGPDVRNWTERSNMPAWGIIETPEVPDEFSMYISEHYRWPTNRLRRITVPRHRFASIHAGSEQGEVATKPINVTGSKLFLNYATAVTGIVQVELQDADGESLDGFGSRPMFGDDFGELVSFKDTMLESLRGKSVRIRFVLHDADVYAFEFRD